MRSAIEVVRYMSVGGRLTEYIDEVCESDDTDASEPN